MTALSRWEVYTSDGRGKRKDRRVVRATTASDAMDVAAEARGWRGMVKVRARRLGDLKTRLQKQVS
jgi:hypothetical protein